MVTQNTQSALVTMTVDYLPFKNGAWSYCLSLQFYKIGEILTRKRANQKSNFFPNGTFTDSFDYKYYANNQQIKT